MNNNRILKSDIFVENLIDTVPSLQGQKSKVKIAS